MLERGPISRGGEAKDAEEGARGLLVADGDGAPRPRGRRPARVSLPDDPGFLLGRPALSTLRPRDRLDTAVPVIAIGVLLTLGSEYAPSRQFGGSLNDRIR